MILPSSDNELIIVTDIHGNYADFQYYLNLWLQDKSNHICFTGDLIHSDPDTVDGSLLILDMVREYIEYPTFHCLLGNHELSQILDDNAWKYGVNQVESFKELVKSTYPDTYQEVYANYIELLKGFEYCLVTSNGLFITHAGIHEYYVKSVLDGYVDIHGFDLSNVYEKRWLTENVWCRPWDDFTEDTVKCFLDGINCQYMICGHTVVDGYRVFGDNTLIFDSSYNTKKKYYLHIELNKVYHSIGILCNDLVMKGLDE